jgi:hypothetical protein
MRNTVQQIAFLGSRAQFPGDFREKLSSALGLNLLERLVV